MDYDALEIELVGVLNTYFGANNLSDEVLLNTVFAARRFPETQTALLQDYSKSQVNVKYSDSTYELPDSTSEICQDETVNVTLYIQADKMNGPDGGYRLLYYVKRALLGYRPVDSMTRMWVTGYGDWRIEDGQMKPFIEFAFKTVVYQVDHDPDTVTIDRDSTVSTGGALLEIDSSLYALPDTETVIGVSNIVLPQPES